MFEKDSLLLKCHSEIFLSDITYCESVFSKLAPHFHRI
jgi:hypothetical protein